MSASLKQYLMLFVKILVTGVALYLVYLNISIGLVKQLLLHIQVIWIAAAVCLFALSKVISSVRLHLLLHKNDLGVPPSYNHKLYVLGMLYNFILPSGIGGDAYKVLKIKTDFGYAHLSLAKVIFFDRVSGLTALCNLAFLLTNIILAIPYVYAVWAIVLSLNIFYYAFLCPYLFPGLLSVKTELLSWLVQTVQCLCALCILLALNIHDMFVPYLFVFLISSIVSVLPISIGGLGAREYTFLIASGYFMLEKDAAVCTGLLFYLISLLISLPGIYFIFRPIKKIHPYVTT